MNHWGIVQGMLNLETDVFTPYHSDVIEIDKPTHKQVRQSSVDLHVAEHLHKKAYEYCKEARIVFVETPAGSQSAAGSKAAGICLGILGSLKSQGIVTIEVTAMESKIAMTGDKKAPKLAMVAAAFVKYPDLNWPRHNGKVMNKAEHIADAIAAIHAGIHTPLYKSLRAIGAH